MSEKKRIRLVVAYDGTNYHGWQVQPGRITIESELNRCLKELLGEEVKVAGASRTDAGVHALGNVAVFDTSTRIPAEKISYALNQYLPEDIRIQASEEVPSHWHPRFAPGRKTYEYRIYRGKFPLPTKRYYSLFTYHELDVAAMREAAGALLGEHDFTSFCQAGAQVSGHTRRIYRAGLQEEGAELVFRITGNGFLYNMVRIIVGTLLEVGQGKRSPSDIPSILKARDRAAAGPTAPAHGLTLVGYEYDLTMPFPAGMLGSRQFRIPAMIETDSGAIVFACDARWEHGMDSAGNLETVAARSADGGRSWERRFVNHFEDVSDGSGRCIFSACFIDPVLAKDSKGTLYLLTDLCPAFVGTFPGGGIVCGKEREGRHPNGRLALKKRERLLEAETLVLSQETYPYYIGDPAEGWVCEGRLLPYGLAPVLGIRDDLPVEGYLVDEEGYLYQLEDATVDAPVGTMESAPDVQSSNSSDGASEHQPDGATGGTLVGSPARRVRRVLIPQLDAGGAVTKRLVHANIFFAASPLKAYPAFHIALRISADDGRTWSRLRIISGQIGAEGFTGICPGRGLSFFYQGKERVALPIYDNVSGMEYASLIYTEDGGRTWRRGTRSEKTGTDAYGQKWKTSESQVVELYDGVLRMYSRSQADHVLYADSFDGGHTWGECRMDDDLKYCGNCMVSVVEARPGQDGRKRLLASFPAGNGEPYERVDGVVLAGEVEKGTNRVRWEAVEHIEGPFGYSCLATLSNGETILAYEKGGGEVGIMKIDC